MIKRTIWEKIEFDAVRIKIRVALLRYNTPWR
jgi:hypothetical protein